MRRKTGGSKINGVYAFRTLFKQMLVSFLVPQGSGFVLENVQYQVQNGTVARAKRASSNQRSKSQDYQQMNAQVVWLDQQFELLPNTGAPLSNNKAAWTTQSLFFIGKKVCGCPHSAIDGKKLFRLVNYFLIADGLPTNFNAPDCSTTKLAVWEFAKKITQISTGDRFIYWTTGMPVYRFHGIVQIGQGLNNPVIDYVPFQTAQIWPSGYKWFPNIWAIPDGVFVQVCGFDDLGRPSTPNLCMVQSDTIP